VGIIKTAFSKTGFENANKGKVCMKNKRLLVLGIALVLMAVVTGVALAATVNGVSFYYEDSYTYFENNNSYGVTVFMTLWNGKNYGSVWLDAGESYSVNAEIKSITVSRIKKAN
jgi:hypothetical protein